MASAITVVGAVLLLLVAVVAYRAVTVVPEGELRALVVFGEVVGIVEPGLNVVPPFAASTYPVDPERMTIDWDGRRVEVPEEHEDAVREHAR